MMRFLTVFVIGSLPALMAASIGNGKEAAVRFPVFLNHFYLTLDHATYTAIQSNEFLRREFAVTEERTTVRKDRTYTGLYFYGTNTYFEFFDADKETRRHVGDSAIAFGVEEPGASEKLQEALGSHSVVITRQLGNVDIPWFYQTIPKGFSLESGISTWVMEYQPLFLHQWHPEAAGGSGISREDILHRYKAVLKGSPAQAYLTNVLAITMAADKQVTRQMIELCKVFGYRTRMDGDTTVLQGPDFELRLAPETGSARGINKVVLRVNGVPVHQTEFQMGSRSVIKFNPDGTALWSF